MKQPDAVDVLLDVVKNVLAEDGSKSRLQGALAALAAVDDPRATEQLMDLADNVDDPELSNAAAREICEVSGLVATDWITRDGGQHPVSRWRASAHAIMDGARADLLRLGFGHRFRLALFGAGGLPRTVSVWRSLAAHSLGGALLTLPAIYLVATSITQGAVLLQLVAIIFFAALIPAAAASLIFGGFARCVPWRAGGWAFVLAEATRAGLLAIVVLFVVWLIEFMIISVANPIDVGGAEAYMEAGALTGIAAVASIWITRAVMALLGDARALRALTVLACSAWALAGATFTVLIGADAVVEGAYFLTPVVCAAMVAAATLVFGFVETSEGREWRVTPRGSRRFGGNARGQLFATGTALAALVFVVIVLSGRVDLLAQADADRFATQFKVGPNEDVKEILIGSDFELTSDHNQTVHLEFETTDVDLETKVERTDGSSTDWQDNDISGTNTEELSVKMTATERVRVFVRDRNLRVDEIDLHNGPNLSAAYSTAKWALIALAGRPPDRRTDSAVLPEIAARMTITTDISADQVAQAEAFEALLTEYRKALKAADASPSEGFAMLFEPLIEGDKLRAKPGGNVVASAGSIVFISDVEADSSTVVLVAGRGLERFDGLTKTRQLAGKILSLSPDNAGELVPQGLAWSSLLANAKELDFFTHRAMEDIRAGRLALARLYIDEERDSRTSRAKGAILLPDIGAPFAGLVSLWTAAEESNVLLALERGWWTQDDIPTAACIVLSRTSLSRLSITLGDGDAEFKEAVIADMRDLYDAEPTDFAPPENGFAEADCLLFDSVRILYSEDDNEEGLFEIDRVEGKLRNIGGTGRASDTLGLAANTELSVLYASLWNPLATVSFGPNGEVDQIESFGVRGAEGLAYDSVNGRIFASRGREFFIAWPGLERSEDIRPEEEIPWEDAECLAFDPASQSVYAISVSTLWRYDVRDETFERVRTYEEQWDDCGLAFDPTARQLLAFGREDAPNWLLSLTPDTGEATRFIELDRHLRGGLAVLP